MPYIINISFEFSNEFKGEITLTSTVNKNNFNGKCN